MWKERYKIEKEGMKHEGDYREGASYTAEDEELSVLLKAYHLVILSGKGTLACSN